MYLFDGKFYTRFETALAALRIKADKDRAMNSLFDRENKLTYKIYDSDGIEVFNTSKPPSYWEC